MRLRRLIRLYQKDPLSRFQGLRYAVRRNHINLLRQIARRYGRKKLSKITARSLLKWHAQWRDGTKVAAAHAFTKKLRAVFNFGLTLLEDKHCARLATVMRGLRFAKVRPRTQRLTLEQVLAIIHQAHLRGWHSIALAQALQFELMLRQKDVIGEYVPETEPGESAFRHRGRKWLRGLTWSEIDDDLILRHVTSKKDKPIIVDLKLAPLVIRELGRMIGNRPTGPLIVCELTGAPYPSCEFRRKWRILADAAGIPKTVKNMDSRASGASEAFHARAPGEYIQTTMTHSDIAQTFDYNRGDYLEKSSEVMRMRAASRPDTARISQ